MFDGKEYYELLAEMNGLPPGSGVDLACSGEAHLAPNLSEDPEWTWRHPFSQSREIDRETFSLLRMSSMGREGWRKEAACYSCSTSMALLTLCISGSILIS